MDAPWVQYYERYFNMFYCVTESDEDEEDEE